METLIRNGKIVNKMFDAFKQGDIPYIISILHHDVIWEVMGQPDIPFAGIYHGPEDVRMFFEKMAEMVEYPEFMVEHILENDNFVVSTGHLDGRVKANGKPFSSIWAMTSEFNEEGKIVHFRDCIDTMAVVRALKS